MIKVLAKKDSTGLTILVALLAVFLSVAGMAQLEPETRALTLIFLTSMVIIVLSIYFISKNPTYGIYLIVLTLPLDVMGRLTEKYPVTLFHVALIVTVLSWLIGLFKEKEIVLYRSTVDLPIAALIASVALSVPLSYSRVETIVGLFRILALFSFFLLVTNNVRSESSVRKLMTWIVMTGVFFALFAFAQYFVPNFGLGTKVLKISMLGVKRVGGFFHDPNLFASFLSVALLISFTFWLSSEREKKLLWLISTLFLSASLIMTFSRTAWIGTFVGLLSIFFLFKDNRLKKMMVIFLAVVIISASIPGPIQGRLLSAMSLTTDASARGRVLLLVSTLEMIRDNPVFGIGVGAFSSAYPSYRKLGVRTTLVKPHQLPLTMWAEAGILGIAALLYLLYVWLRLWKGKRTALEVAAVSAVISLTVQNLFYYFLYNDYLWLMMALSMSAYYLNKLNGEEKGIDRVQV